MHKSRHRARVLRSLSGSRYGSKWRINLCVLAVSFVLLGSVLLIQMRLAQVYTHPSHLPGVPEEWDVDSSHEGLGKQKLDRIWRKMGYKKTDSVEDNGSSVRSLSEALKISEVEVGDRLKDSTSKNDDMDFDDEDGDEFESFDGDGAVDEAGMKESSQSSNVIGGTNGLRVNQQHNRDVIASSLRGESTGFAEGGLDGGDRRRVELGASNGVEMSEVQGLSFKENAWSRAIEKPGGNGELVLPFTAILKSSKSQITSEMDSNVNSTSRSDLTRLDEDGVRRGLPMQSKEGPKKLDLQEKLEGDSSIGVYSTDDEPINEETRNRLEHMLNIEDVLMINHRPPSHYKESLGAIQDAESAEKGRGEVFSSDPINPANIVLLQDPDSFDQGGATKNDRASRTAVTWTSVETRPLVPYHINADRHKNLYEDSKTERKDNEHKGLETDVDPWDAEVDLNKSDKLLDKHFIIAPSVRLELENNDNISSANAGGQGDLGTYEEGTLSGVASGRSVETSLDTQGLGIQVPYWIPRVEKRKWGNFPGLDPLLTFSGFMKEFYIDGKCSPKVFMVWTTPPWSFTVRHQRVLESLLHIHPQACVVVFSETLELEFFTSFVEDGYRVAVVFPNLDELLVATPMDVFASIWMEWRKVDLFYIHYSELLRLAALYKYGGIYLDLDVIVLKPLTSLKNIVSSEVLPSGQQRPNGAVMVFERHSPFLNMSMVEFTATYDETLRDWNGAALLTRVLNALPDGDDVKLAIGDKPTVEPPFSFFPLSSTNITRYFQVSEDDESVAEEQDLLSKILLQSTGVHIWNAMTSALVPEPGSLVEILMDMNCLRCSDSL